MIACVQLRILTRHPRVLFARTDRGFDCRETEFYHILSVTDMVSVTDIVSVTVLGTIKREYYGRMKSSILEVFFQEKAKGRSGMFEETVGYDEP